MASDDTVIIGSGPNGLAAAIMLARAGWSVTVREGAPTIGGSTRSAALTLEGFIHDVCASVPALAPTSPFFRDLPLEQHGLRWIFPPASFAHPLDDGSAGLVMKSVHETSDSLGADARAYRRLMQPLVDDWPMIADDVFAPPRPPRHPFAIARFGMRAIRSATALATTHFKTPRARALFAGVAGHATTSLDLPATAGFGLVLTLAAHQHGWPIVEGGTQALANAMAGCLLSLGGRIETAAPVVSLDEFPDTRLVFCDVTPRQFLKLAGRRLSTSGHRRFSRYRYGPGSFKMDFALDGPIPWRAKQCAMASTVHLGGTMEEIASSERDAWRGRHSAHPYVLLVQSSLFDATRAPAGKHTAWAYCHVPHGSQVDMRDRIERQIERFAPGFRDRILARRAMNTIELERHNPNLVGGDICGGANDLLQLAARPFLQRNPYATPLKNVYLCSSSTPPGGGVHGQCGYHAAQSVLRMRRSPT